MTNRKFQIVLLLSLSLLVAVGAFAQTATTGSIEGTVKQAGTPLPGVTVEVRSPALQGVRTVVTDAAGNFRPMQQILLEVANAFKAHASDGENGARAMALFGRAGRDLLPVLALGRDGLIQLEQKAQEMGLTLSGDNVTAIYKYTQAQKDLDEAIGGLKIQLGTALIPLFKEAAQAASKWAEGLNSDGGKGIKSFTDDIHGAADHFALVPLEPTARRGHARRRDLLRMVGLNSESRTICVRAIRPEIVQLRRLVRLSLPLRVASPAAASSATPWCRSRAAPHRPPSPPRRAIRCACRPGTAPPNPR